MKVDDDTRFAIMMWRALGFTEHHIATTLRVDQTTVSYHLSKLRSEVERSGSPERTFMSAIARSPRALDLLLTGIRQGFVARG